MNQSAFPCGRARVPLASPASEPWLLRVSPTLDVLRSLHFWPSLLTGDSRLTNLHFPNQQGSGPVWPFFLLAFLLWGEAPSPWSPCSAPSWCCFPTSIFFCPPGPSVPAPLLLLRGQSLIHNILPPSILERQSQAPAVPVSSFLEV